MSNPVIFDANRSNASNVVLQIINNNKGNGTTVFADQSYWSHNVTASGAAQYVTAQAPTGMTSSMLLDGASDFLTVPGHPSAFNFTSGTWSIEFPWRFNSLSVTNVQPFYEYGYDALANRRCLVFYWQNSDTTLVVGQSTTGGNNNSQSVTWSPSINVWYWIQLINDGSVVKVAVDGVQVGADLTKYTLHSPGTAKNVHIGDDNQGVDSANGWMGPMRVKKGSYSSIGAMPSLPYAIPT